MNVPSCLKIVNTVWKGDILTPIELNSLNISGVGILKVRHQTKQPEQYIVNFTNKSTMLIFKSGKFRVMGNGDPCAAIENILNVINQISDVIPIVDVQTMTGVYSYGKKVNLHLLSEASGGFLDLENFPAVQIRKFKPIHANVFSTGCVTICGLKKRDDYKIVKDYIDCSILNCFVKDGSAIDV